MKSLIEFVQSVQKSWHVAPLDPKKQVYPGSYAHSSESEETAIEMAQNFADREGVSCRVWHSLQKESEGVIVKPKLKEEAPISMYSKNFGFITLAGKVVKGVPEEELHSTVARRLGFGGSQPEQKAIQAGLVRFAVGDGNASFQYIPTDTSNTHVKKFIKNTDEIVGTVYFDLVSGKRVVKSEELSVDKAIKTVLRMTV